MTGKLRVGVIGAGDMGMRHLRGWQNVLDAEVVALVEGVPERLEAAVREAGVTALFTDYQVAINETRPDVVSVCLPTSFHAPVSIYALENGAHVLCEKPIALTLEDAQAMQEAAIKNGKLLAVGFMLRYSAAFARLKEWIKEGRIGRPILAISENFMDIRPKIVMHAKNINGGPIVDYWCHDFDLWSWLFESKPQRVAGYGATFAGNKPEVAGIRELAIDTAGVVINYYSGDIAQFSTSWGLPRSLAAYGFSGDKFVGPNGIIYGDIRKELILVQADGTTESISNAGINWWQDEILAFVRAIREGGSYIDAENGLKALELSLAVLKAIESGKTITL
jgi:predicted dehydrogenase